MGKITIRFDDNVDAELALKCVFSVVKDGRISDDGKSYCYVTSFGDEYFVYANRNSDVSDTFQVTKRA